LALNNNQSINQSTIVEFFKTLCACLFSKGESHITIAAWLH